MKSFFPRVALTLLMAPVLLMGVLPVGAEETAPFLTYEELRVLMEGSADSVAAVYTSSEGAEMPYRLYVPEGYDPEKAYPLVIFFHGAGERGSENDHLFRGGSILQHLLTEQVRREHPCLILAPQCPIDSQWVLSSWTPGTYRHERIEKSPYMTATEELLDEVIATYAVDEAALYVSGISMGGFGTWDLISRYPERFAAAIPVCGGVDVSYMEGLRGFPIRTFHAKDDGTVSCNGTVRAARVLEGYGDFVYTEYPTGGHLIWDTAYSTEGLMDWLFAQRNASALPETEPETTPETVPETEAETVPEAVPETASETLTDTAPATDRAGCASAVGAGTALLAAMAAGVALKRRN